MFSRRRKWQTPILVGVIVAALTVAAAFLVIVLIVHKGHGNPDPGGRRLTALRAVAAALPPDARVLVRNEGEPQWDSCDGRAGTFGWNEVEVDFEFTTNAAAGSMLAAAARTLTRLGWTVSQYTGLGGPHLSGRRTIAPGIPLRAVLSADYATGGLVVNWDLSALAPLNGRESSGC